MTREELNIRISELQEIQDKKLEKFYAWIKNLITLSVGLFGILISFKSDLPMSMVKSILFAISISSLGFGILFGLIVQFSEVSVLDQLKSSRVKRTIKELDGIATESDFDVVTESIFYRISKVLCVLFYIVSLFSLIGYSIYDLLKNIW
ncbi:hypothetical protein [Flavobacterium muglaense]|uniref:Uncharacterized protein n=1 Tax=Flavobacterium muglaense TaxID=2764716 RepID=A0A923SI25_9FLAO|nr:hypothetical protein [Flavobacterium muglaense]MBC5839772.1 hypothetical protein [Flavobacterium muglaense]MBC5846299.1 hypothetical protein [Flavobacterium muglaense]